MYYVALVVDNCSVLSTPGVEGDKAAPLICGPPRSQLRISTSCSMWKDISFPTMPWPDIWPFNSSRKGDNGSPSASTRLENLKDNLLTEHLAKLKEEAELVPRCSRAKLASMLYLLRYLASSLSAYSSSWLVSLGDRLYSREPQSPGAAGKAFPSDSTGLGRGACSPARPAPSQRQHQHCIC